MQLPGHGWKFIDLAALGNNRVRSYLLTLLCVILAPMASLGAVLGTLLFAATKHWVSPAVGTTGIVVTAFGAVVVAGLALAWGVTRLHRRPWLSLVATDLRLDWRRLAIGAGVEGVLVAALLYLTHLTSGTPLRVPSTLPLPGLALVMLLIPLQAASEEMLFRGYLTQALGRIVRNRAVIAAGVGLAFGAMHFNAYGALTIPYLFTLSAIYSVVTLRDERLELTIGAHAAMNWLAVGASDVLARRAEIQLSWAALAALMVHGLLFYLLTRLLVRRFCEDGPALDAATPRE